MINYIVTAKWLFLPCMALGACVENATPGGLIALWLIASLIVTVIQGMGEA